MNRVHRSDMERHLPELRRYAFLMTGAKDAGDDLVEACLRMALDAPERIGGKNPRVDVFKLFHMANADLPVRQRPDPSQPWGLQERVFNHLLALPQQERAILALRGSLDFSEEEIGLILELAPRTVREILIRTRAHLAKTTLARILIIEDDFLIASEIASIVQQTGQEVCGPAATYDDALRWANQCEPALVLADVQLRDGKFAGIEAAHDIRRQHGSPVIFITAYPDRLTRTAAFAPLTVLSKPLNYAALRETITTSLAPAA